MKILFVFRHVAYFRFFDVVIRELAAEHTVKILLSERHDDDAGRSHSKNSPRALLACAAEVTNVTWDWALRRRGLWRKPLALARGLRNYSFYLQPGRQSSQTILKRAEEFLPQIVWPIVRPRPARAWLATSAVQSLLRGFEALVPPNRAILNWLRDYKPDVVVAAPYLLKRSEEVEYIKAAAALRLPTIVPVNSWDNLTTKGVFHILPDMALVWNEIQMDEAVRLHGLPKDRVVFTGAPVFDGWFKMRPTLERESFCRQAGLDPGQPFVLYLCSSWSIAQDETAFVEQVAEGLRQNPATRHVNLLVRPHPWNVAMWQNYPGDSFTVWPRGGDNPDTAEARHGFYHSLHYSAAAIGINTSAMIDAAIVDKPCVTILAEKYRDTQQGISHFQYLLNGDFLEAASDAAGAAEVVAAILQGRDAKRDNRRRFVREFVRPWGIDRPASSIMAGIIEEVARL